MAKRGKLIVIDGTDGSGKATQTRLLIEHLKYDGKKIEVVDFPEYYSNFFGKFVGHCLSEQYYNFIKVHPKIASVLFAADRFESKEKIESWLKAGKIVIANRYVSANQIHQGGKIKSPAKRKAFIEWLNKMEYGVFQIPKPDVVFYLDVPIPTVIKLIEKRNKTQNRKYLGKKKDVHEMDVEHLENSRKSALWLSKIEKNWVKINCMNGKDLLRPEPIHEKIYKEVKKVIK